MKRVVITSNTAWTIFNHRAGLIKTLQDAGYEVHTVAPESNFTDIQNPGTIFHPVKNLERKGKNPFSDLFLIREYYKIYKVFRIINKICATCGQWFRFVYYSIKIPFVFTSIFFIPPSENISFPHRIGRS